MNRKKTCSLCGINIFRKDCITLQKLRYEPPVVELLQFEAEDVIRTSSDLSNGNPGGTAPDFDCDNTWPTYP